MSDTTQPGTPRQVDYRRIATEEAWAPAELLARYRAMAASKTIDDPGFIALWTRLGARTQLGDRLADIGDWRYDLLTLAWWTTYMRFGVAPLAVDRLHEVTPPDALALITAVRTITQLDFDARNNPQFLPGLSAGIEAHIAPWWRALSL